MTRVRGEWVAIGQSVVGAVLLTRPRAVGRSAAGRDGTAPPAWLVRLLGARCALQGVATAVAPGPRVLLAGAAADGAHALSMVPVLVGSRSYRRAAALSAALAVAGAVVGCVAAGTARPELGGRDAEPKPG